MIESVKQHEYEWVNRYRTTRLFFIFMSYQ
jgi:hypothetical protein